METIESIISAATTEVPIDTRGAILSLESRKLVETINYAFLSTAVCAFGIFANIINIVIFFKQGLNTTVNISLFGIAISDLCGLITTMWLNICFNPLFENSDVPMVTSEVQYLTGGWPHVCFSRITCGITVYVTAERCLCITIPLRVKQIITPRRTKIAIVVIYIFMILSMIPEYSTAYIGWKYYSERNKTLLGLIFTSNRSSVEGLVYVLNATLGIVCFLAVSLCTGILIWKLKSAAEWRKKSTIESQQSKSISVREKKTMNLIVFIATILIICYMPGTALLLATFFEPEFDVLGRYVNLFLALWSFGLLFEAINASVNIFLYYRMSSRYRQTFQRMFSRWLRRRRLLTATELCSERSSTTVTQRFCGDRSDSNNFRDLTLDLQRMDGSYVSLTPETPIRTPHAFGYSPPVSGQGRCNGNFKRNHKTKCYRMTVTTGFPRSMYYVQTP